mmetsp:Transcript_123482/g.348994  ORF Transcript_123482/g.348994 Transcript_123482/m.348994 type:complete len:514 (-) Transcript_123482:75-1616(-)
MESAGDTLDEKGAEVGDGEVEEACADEAIPQVSSQISERRDPRRDSPQRPPSGSNCSKGTADWVDDLPPGGLLALLMRPLDTSSSDAASPGCGRSRGQSRSRSRERSRSPEPQAKKMPRPRPRPPKYPPPGLSEKPQPPADTTAQSSTPVGLMRAKPKLLARTATAGYRGAESRTACGGSPPSSYPMHSPRQAATDRFLGMQVLARHAARLGPACLGLESAVWKTAKRCCSKAGLDSSSVWSFLFQNDGWDAYEHEKLKFSAVYSAFGYDRWGDERVRKLLPLGSQATRSAAVLAPRDASCDVSAGSHVGSTLELPIQEVRFAHDAQSEHFGKWHEHTDTRQTLLQLAVELLAGLTWADSVPEFTVCHHEGHWYCRSGNRRLAAFRLAHRFAPQRFGQVRVKVVPVDDAFLHGTLGRLPKLTTSRNGPKCFGRWIVVRETGEAVGHGWLGTAEYGADLLALLLPLFEAAHSAATKPWTGRDTAAQWRRRRWAGQSNCDRVAWGAEAGTAAAGA